MTVSGIIERSATQEMAVSLNQGAVQNYSKDIERDREVDRTEHRRTEDISTKKLLESKGQKLATDIFKNMFSKLSAAGISLNNKNQPLNEQDLEALLGRAENLEDLVEIRSDSPIVEQTKRSKERQEGQGRNFNLNSQELQGLIKDFAAVLAEYLATNQTQLLEQIKDLKKKLKAQGLSEEQIAKLESGVREGRKADIGTAIKESMLLSILALDNKIEKGVRDRGLGDLISVASRHLDDGEVRDLMGRARQMAADELKGFLAEELENKLIKTTYTQSNDYSEIFKLLKAADKVGFDYRDWMENVWPQKKEDHGLFLMDVPHSATGMNVNTNTDNPTSQGQKHGYEYEKDDEKEVLLNRLRALYMQGALKQGFFSNLETIFKVRKLKNGLFRLGVMTPELDDQVKHEAEVLAKMKTMEMLSEGLLERATLYDLSGPAYDLIERKIKGLLKNAERLGMPISTEEFNKMKDKANCEVFAISKKELEDVRSQVRQNSSKKLAKKEKLLIRLMTRLSEESSITDASFSLVDSINT